MRKYAVIASLIAVLLLAAFFGAMNGGGVTPALGAAPTPVSITQPVGLEPQLYTLFSGVVTTSTQGTCRELGKWAVADIQTVIDVSNTQTVTLKMQYSNDGVNLVDGANIVAASADTNTLTQLPLFARYACAYATLGSTNTVTVTVTGWAK